MKIDKVTSIYFSPTGTTRRAATAFAGGAGPPHEDIDLTTPKSRQSFKRSFAANELVIVGLPVYSGRLPMNIDSFFSGLKGNGALAAALVVYGNRAYEDALLELEMRLEERGFRVIAGAAFIGEHTFSNKIATGRPDENDLRIAGEFGRRTVGASGQTNQGKLNLKGNYPFVAQGFDPNQPGRPLTTYGKVLTTADCTHCDFCAPECPWGAISFDEAVATDYTKCMHCYRCMKVCPVGARKITEEKYYELLPDFEKRLNATRKEPELFLPG